MNTEKRNDTFEAFSTHPWFGKVFKRLKNDDLSTARCFLKANGHLGKGEFEFAVNRMFLDKPKPKNWKEIQELLTCANSVL